MLLGKLLRFKRLSTVSCLILYYYTSGIGWETSTPALMRIGLPQERKDPVRMVKMKREE